MKRRESAIDRFDRFLWLDKTAWSSPPRRASVYEAGPVGGAEGEAGYGRKSSRFGSKVASKAADCARRRGDVRDEKALHARGKGRLDALLHGVDSCNLRWEWTLQRYCALAGPGKNTLQSPVDRSRHCNRLYSRCITLTTSPCNLRLSGVDTTTDGQNMNAIVPDTPQSPVARIGEPTMINSNGDTFNVLQSPVARSRLSLPSDQRRNGQVHARGYYSIFRIATLRWGCANAHGSTTAGTWSAAPNLRLDCFDDGSDQCDEVTAGTEKQNGR